MWVEIYFGFHAPKPLWRGGTPYQMFGHVEAWGYTRDNTWFFFDPGRHSSQLHITHRYDEVELLLAQKHTVCAEIYRTSDEQQFSVPIHFSMNCVTQCAALVGIRAFTPKGFRRKLLKNNAEKIHGTEGRP